MVVILCLCDVCMFLLHCDTCVYMNFAILITLVVIDMDKRSYEIIMYIYDLDDVFVCVIVVC